MQTAFTRFVRDILTAWRPSLALHQLHAFTRIAPVGVTSCLLLLSLFYIALCSGCREHSVGARAEASPSVSRRSTSQAGSAGVQQSAEYAQALALYKAGDHAGALVKIERMLANPQVTGEQRVFLERQKAICEGNKAAHTASPLPNTAKELSAKGDCGPRALAILCKRLGITATSEELSNLAGTNRDGTTLEGLAKAARAKGLTAEGMLMDATALKRLEGVAVAWADGDHYLAVIKVEGERATIEDPNTMREEVVETDALLRRSGGILLTLQRTKPDISGIK